MKILTLGEILIRFTPNEQLINSSQFNSYIGGGEFNTISYLSNNGHHSAIITALADNDLGYRVAREIRQNQIDDQFIQFYGSKQGCYFVNPATNMTSSEVIYDRINSSFWQANFNLTELADQIKNYDLLHLSGITPALNQKTRMLTITIIKLAHQLGLKISYDSNFRAKLWNQEEAGTFLKIILPKINYLFAGNLDCKYLLGYQNEKLIDNLKQLRNNYPNLEYIASTNREVHSPVLHEISVNLFHTQQQELIVTKSETVAIIDRIGTGDAFTAGILLGIINGESNQTIANYGLAFNVLAHQFLGDYFPISLRKVKEFNSDRKFLIKR